MITTRHMSVETELLRWLLLMAAAIALALAIATALGASDSLKEPRLLPKDAGALAKPMARELVKPFFPEMSPGRQLPPAEAAARIGMILDDHRADRLLEALNGWEQVGLPEETAHWREIAISAAYLRVGDLERASLHLGAARQLAPDHAIVAYFTGLLRLEQAAAAARLPDSRQRVDRFVMYTPTDDKLLYETLAIGELNLAIMRAPNIRLDERLVAVDPLEEAIMVPRAGDLIEAIGADNFVGKGHHLLFGLLLGRGELDAAEFHLDQAAATGIAVLYGYRDMAERYLQAGQNAEAIRLCNKDLQINHPWVSRTGQWLLDMMPDRASGVWVW